MVRHPETRHPCLETPHLVSQILPPSLVHELGTSTRFRASGGFGASVILGRSLHVSAPACLLSWVWCFQWVCWAEANLAGHLKTPPEPETYFESVGTDVVEKKGNCCRAVRIRGVGHVKRTD